MIKIKQNVPLNSFTTFKIGGKAKYFCKAENKQDFISAIKWAKQNMLPFFVLGGGSNLLICDRGFNGLVIKIENKGIARLSKISNSKNKHLRFLSIQAGTSLRSVIKYCLEQNLSGIEWAQGIPKATIGGAVYGNAGAFGSNIADVIEQVEVIDIKTLKTKIISFEKCAFGYKTSIFKKNKNLIILSVVLGLEKKLKQEIRQEIKRVLEYRKANHPKEPSSGCVFKNPNKVPAAYLIEKCGLKGKQIGKAKISEKHCNFIINLGKASSDDVKALIDLAKQKVKNKFNIILKEEVQYLE